MPLTPVPRRALMVSADIGEGHNSAGRALEEAIARAWPGCQVRWLDEHHEDAAAGPAAERVIAARLTADGFDVAVAHAGEIDLADATVSEVKDHGRIGAAFAADIADEHEVSDLFDAVDDRFGGLDVVVHTAGINRRAALSDLDLADFDAIHRVNVRGTFVVDQQAARRVRSGGSIVNVSSSMVRVAPPALSAYTASKAAVDALTCILAKELRGRDITVNAVAPGPTATASDDWQVKGAAPRRLGWAPPVPYGEVAKHSIDFWLSSEDLPLAESRITLRRDGAIRLALQPGNNTEALARLRRSFQGILSRLGMAETTFVRSLYLHKAFDAAATAHQAGTARFGTDPATSVLDVYRKAHDLDNLYVVDGSFMPSIGAVNPTLTIIANVLRVGDHIAERIGTLHHPQSPPTV